MSESHAPDGYPCPFCRIAAGLDDEHTSWEHVVLHDNRVTAFVASHWWPANPGHVLVIPNEHYENLYELPSFLAEPILIATQRVARAFKAAYGCDGVSTRQHNEPAGNQDVWHFHQHVFPRFAGDALYERHRERTAAPPAEIARRAAMLRGALQP